ncbi:MAG: AT hook motif domain protein, partial [Deltaproteobacteria bacterium]|nr:AT hook motif domain protein [Deltaproteobacteria bacterium]
MPDQAHTPEKVKRPRGRPKRADAPIVPWDEVDRLLVFGEKVTDPETGFESASFPSFGELAKRYGVSKSRIGQYATSAKCLERRKEATLKTQARYEQKVIERT